jgi:hypothetical protein
VSLSRPSRRAISIASGLVASFVRQCADFGAGVMLGLYLRFINDAVHPISGTAVGLVGVGFYVASLVLSPVLGRLSDSRGRKPFIILGALIGAAVVQLYPLTASLPLVFAALALEGMGNASEGPALLGFLSDSTRSEPALRGKVMALYQIVSTASMALGYLAGGILWEHLGLSGFRLLSLLYLVGAGITLWGLEEAQSSPERTTRSQTNYLHVVSDPTVARLFGIGLIFDSVLGIWFAQSAFQMSGESARADQLLMGVLSGSQVGVVFAVFALVFSAGTYLWGSVSARTNRTTIMGIALSGMYVVLLALYLINRPGGSTLVPSYYYRACPIGDRGLRDEWLTAHAAPVSCRCRREAFWAGNDHGIVQRGSQFGAARRGMARWPRSGWFWH